MTNCKQCFRQELHQAFVGTIISIALHNTAFRQNPERRGNGPLLTRRIQKAQAEGEDIMQRILNFSLDQRQHECILGDQSPKELWEPAPSSGSAGFNEPSDYFGPWWIYTQGGVGQFETDISHQMTEPAESSGANQSSDQGLTQAFDQGMGLFDISSSGRPEAWEFIQAPAPADFMVGLEQSGNSNAAPGAIALDQEPQRQIQELVEMGQDWILTGRFPEHPEDQSFPPLDDPYWSHLHVASERLAEWIRVESQKRSLPPEDEQEEEIAMDSKRVKLDNDDNDNEGYWRWNT